MDNIRIYGSDKKKIEAVADIYEEDTEDTLNDFMDKFWDKYVNLIMDQECYDKYKEKTERKSVWTV